MRIAAAMLTWNMHATGRADMFATTYDSLVAGGPDAFTLVTNGSTDGTQDDVRRLGGIVDDTRSEIWYGVSVALHWALRQGCEIVLFSADDIRYLPDWRERLLSFWSDAPESLKLASLFLEPEWDWNRPYAAADIGGERVLLRESAPGASWTFRARDWRHIGPVPMRSPGEDLLVCQRLRAAGCDIAQLELAEHIGEAASAWGNQSHLSARPLDRARWGLSNG